MSDGFEWSSSGWFVALLTATWGFVLRLLIGKHFRKWDLIEERLGNIEKDLYTIKGRFNERDRNGRVTWPGDHD